MDKLHVFLFPFMSHGHKIAILDIAKLFTSRGVKSTMITIPLNAPFFKKIITETKNQASGNEIDILIIEFPSFKAGLPQGCKNSNQIPSGHLIPKFIMATTMLENQLERLLAEHKSNCLVVDAFFPWATYVAAKFDIPRLVFHGTSSIASCADESVKLYTPQKSISTDYEPFILPNLPHEVKLTKMHFPPSERQVTEVKPETGYGKLLKEVRESELKSNGVIVNSFYEFERDYAVLYKLAFRRRAWNIARLFYTIEM